MRRPREKWNVEPETGSSRFRRVRSLLNTLELKFGHWALHGLLRWIAGLQLICFFLGKLQPEFLDRLILNREDIFSGEVWRLVTFVMVPRTDSFLWIVFATWFMFFLSDVLEQAWGAFRLNAYYFSGAILLIAGALTIPGWPMMGLESRYLSLSLFLAVAAIIPDYEINMMGLIPVKCKYLAGIDAAYMAYQFFMLPPLRPVIGAALLPFFLFVLPDLIRALRQQAGATVRRARFQAAAGPSAATFHRCHACGKTEKSDPHAEFRIAADDEEYCAECLAKRA